MSENPLFYENNGSLDSKLKLLNQVSFVHFLYFLETSEWCEKLKNEFHLFLVNGGAGVQDSELPFRWIHALSPKRACKCDQKMQSKEPQKWSTFWHFLPRHIPTWKQIDFKLFKPQIHFGNYLSQHIKQSLLKCTVSLHNQKHQISIHPFKSYRICNLIHLCHRATDSPSAVEGTISAAARSAYFSQHKACDACVFVDVTESLPPRFVKRIWAHSPFQQPWTFPTSWVQSSSHLGGLACGPTYWSLNMAFPSPLAISAIEYPLVD